MADKDSNMMNDVAKLIKKHNIKAAVFMFEDGGTSNCYSSYGNLLILQKYLNLYIKIKDKISETKMLEEYWGSSRNNNKKQNYIG